MYKECKTVQSSNRQRQIAFCLLDMMSAQLYPSITVQALCQRAEIPRKSFYRYFDCKDDVFFAAVDLLVQDCLAYQLDHGVPENEPASPEGLACFFTYWKARSGWLEGIWRSNLFGLMIARIAHQYDHYSQETAARPDAFAAVSQHTYTIFVLYGLYSVLADWIARGCQESVTQMASQVRVLMTCPLRRDAPPPPNAGPHLPAGFAAEFFR